MFSKYIDDENRGKSIEFDKVAQKVQDVFGYQMNEDFLNRVKEERNGLFHFSDKEIAPDFSLKFLFEIIIPFIEKEFPDDLEIIFEYMGEYDEVIFEGYLIEQLEQNNIEYSDIIKRKFSHG